MALIPGIQVEMSRRYGQAGLGKGSFVLLIPDRAPASYWWSLLRSHNPADQISERFYEHVAISERWKGSAVCKSGFSPTEKQDFRWKGKNGGKFRYPR